MMPDLTADVFLAFSSPSIIFLIIIAGFLLINRQIFFHAACIGALDIVVNVALKGTFKVPLSSALGLVGYAFPSGHMQLSTVFYGWLALYIPFWIWRAVVLVILLGIAGGLIHYQYHDLYDVLGGLGCGILLIALYDFFLARFPKQLLWGVLILASGLMVYNWWVYITIPYHAWVAYLILIGFIAAEKILSKYLLKKA